MFVALGCICASKASAATRVFYDGSEAGNTNLWSQADYRDKCTSVTSAADGVTGPYSGSRMIRCNTDGTVAWNTPKWFETMALNSFPYTNEFLFRAEVRVDKNHARSGDSPKKILRWFTGSIDYFDSIHDSSGFKNEGPITSGSYWGDAPGDNTASSQKWGKVEVYYNSSNRKLREWHDDVLIRDETTGNLGGKWYPLYITSNYEQVPSGDSLNYVYFDDVEIYSDATSGTPSASGTMANGDVLVSGGSGGTSDTTPPSSPTNLAANATSASGISVSWNSATDNVGVVGYQIERCTGLSCSNFTQVGTPSSSPFVDSNLSASTGYSYHVRAVDAAGNTSSWSNVVGATTQDVAQTPTVTLSANPTSIASGSSSVLTWSSTNATSCTASGSWSGTKSTSGTQSVSPTSTSTYTLTCTGTGGSANQSVTVTVSDPNEVIIDNTDTASVSSSGSWLPSTAYPGYYGSDYFYSSTTAGEWFQWTASSLVPGTYEVYARWLAVTGRPTDVNYQVTHASGAATVGPVNQEINGSQWNLLGTYSFNTTGAVKVIGTATGWEGTAADAVRFLKVTSSTPQPCSTVTPTNFTTSTYTGYGAPYDVFASNTPLISTTCTSSDTHTINATLGITGDTTRIVYTKGYYYDPGISDWTSFTGTCTGALNGDWCQGSVSATLTDTDISTASASDPAYLVGMTCSIQGGRWKCGCRDTTCSTFYWQVQGAGM
ncbi:MAG: fibronectin type III domain-containing protein [Candidatus Moraniibacteriota bacterium]|nr:MAG: fibronectin type III domain-containing protein [Candidatus Moranbacteria bacterium]